MAHTSSSRVVAAATSLRRRLVHSKTLLPGFLICLIMCSFCWWSGFEKGINQEIAVEAGSRSHPFTGEFANFSRVSALAPEQRRLTLVAIWIDDDYQPYLRHFFHTVQLNADSVDLLLVNRIITPGKGCLDPKKHGLDVTWGGNVKMHCITDEEWKKRFADFVCSKDYGWGCNDRQHKEVVEEFKKRPDENNLKWRPLRGYVFHYLFANPQNPFWAWLDFDCFLGDFRKYPFNVLSQVSIMTGYQEQPANIFMAGQLTAFNTADKALGSAWKKFPGMKTPEHFTKAIDGVGMPESSEERYWSYGYLRSDAELPGSDLAWVMYPDIHADDLFDGRWRKRGASETHLISGRELILVSSYLSRAEMENVLLFERQTPPDDMGDIGWTEDRSVIEDTEMSYKCATNPTWRQCVSLHPLAASKPPIYRQSLVRLRGHRQGHILRRLDPDDRPRAYERKLLRHFLKAKKEAWFDFPPFEITDDLVMKVNYDGVEVWRMGSEREKTLFLRREGATSIG